MRSALARTLQFLFVYLAAFTALATQPSPGPADAAFPQLKHLDTGLGFALYYDPALSEVLAAPHPHADSMEESGLQIERPLRTRLNGDRQWFTIDCDTGPSADLSCTVYREARQRLRKVASLRGERFFFPGDGTVYTEGKNDENFKTRRKYSWRDGALSEVKQPFYFVGLDSTTLVDLDLFSSKEFRQPVARLPKGTAVTVLLNEAVDLGDDDHDSANYLVKTPFGLIGWIRSPVDQAPVIEGLLYHGD